jgi:glutathione S-transferase kappa 1
MVADLQTLPKFFQVPLQFPSNFVSIAMSRQVIPPQRFLVSVQQTVANQDAEQRALIQLSRAMYAAMFKSSGELIPLDTPDRLRELAAIAGLQPDTTEKALQQMNSDSVKDELRRNVDEAVKAGVFGTPSFLVERPEDAQPQLVFGSDRIEVLAYLLGEKYQGPVPSV